MGPDQAGQGTAPGSQLEHTTSVSDRRLNFAPVADDGRVQNQPFHIPIVEGGDDDRVKGRKSSPESFSFAKDGQPRKAALEPLQAQLFVDAVVVPDGTAPFLVVVVPVFGRRNSPGAPGDAVVTYHCPISHWVLSLSHMVGLEEIEQAAERVRQIVRPTPAMFSGALTKLVGRRVFVKPEHFQRTGSFKIRGAFNRISTLAAEGATEEIVAASAGNHAQGVALASSVCGLRSTVFMPSGASLPKIEATRSYGAEVRFEPGNVDDAIAAARRYAEDRGAYYVPPFDDPLVIAGQGTIGLEVANEVPDAEAVLVPVGGGGLVSGVAAALKGSGCHARVVGVEAAGAAAMLAALAAGGPVELGSLATMADGIAVRCVSQLTFEHVRALVDEVITVDEEQISRAVLLFLERCKWVVEPAGAVPLAALLAGAVPGDDPVVLVVSGGNVDPLLLTRLVEYGLTAAGRYFMVRVVLPDKPGALASLTRALGVLGLNLLTVEHRRLGAPVGVSEAEVILTLETLGPADRDMIIPFLQERGFRAEAYRR